MNNLSFLLYLADVAGSINSFLVMTAIICFFSILLGILIGFARKDTNETEDFWKNWKKAMFTLPSIFFVSLLLGVLVPSKQTVYAIVVSEMGEEVLDSPTANKAIKGLDAWLDNQIKSIEKGSEEEEE